MSNMNNSCLSATGYSFSGTTISCNVTSATTSITSATTATSTAINPSTFTFNAAGSVTGFAVSKLINLSSENDSGLVEMSGPDPIIRTDRGDINLNHLLKIVRKAEAVLCLLEENQKRLDKYPALQNAYDHYRIIDALCQDDSDNVD